MSDRVFLTLPPSPTADIIAAVVVVVVGILMFVHTAAAHCAIASLVCWFCSSTAEN